MPSSGVQTCARSEEHTSELQSLTNLVCRLLLENKTRSEEHTSELQSLTNLVYRLLLEKKIGLSAEVRTGITVVNNGYTIPGVPQMLSIAINHLMITAFGFEPLIATALFL